LGFRIRKQNYKWSNNTVFGAYRHGDSYKHARGAFAPRDGSVTECTASGGVLSIAYE
jgi:hypothetical protein